MKTKAIAIAFLAFGLGLVIGICWAKSASVADLVAVKVKQAEGELAEQGGGTPSQDDEVSSDAEETSCPDDEVAPSATVEVIVDSSPKPESEVRAAHVARQAKRHAAREAKEKGRIGFFSTLNLDLLTEDQRKCHAIYVEALETRAVLSKKVSALRASGEEVPSEMQSRLADVESVLQADRAAEFRALREAAFRAAGLGEPTIRQLLDDLTLIEESFEFFPNEP